jgi:ethanolamine utilization protein EutA
VSHDRGETILNIDIGGGTTKLAVVNNGTVVHTAAIHLGGRLAVVDRTNRLVRLDPAGARAAARAGCEWRLGDTVAPADFDRVAEWMADALTAALAMDPGRADVADLWLTEPLPAVGGIAGAMFSGGVGEYVYGREQRDFCDLGLRFGRAIRHRLDRGGFPYSLLPAGECIRATALGASEYTVQLSGNTIYLSNPGDLLPRRNLQVVRPRLVLGDEVTPASVTGAITEHLRSFDVVEGESEVALAFRWRGAPAHGRLAGLARGIVDAMPRTIAKGAPLFIVLDADVAQTLGAILRDELGVRSEVLVLDGIALLDFDYIDLGRVRMPSFTVPVTIKSLVFSTDPRMPHQHRHDRHSHQHHGDRTHPQHGHDHHG